MTKLEEIFEADVVNEGYSGWNGWIEELYIQPVDNRLLEDVLEKFTGKKVKITIEEL